MLKQDEIISVKQLAEQVGVSKRTVQRELEYIESSLKPYQVAFLSRTGVGVWLEGTHEAKQKLLEEIKSEDSYDNSNREERRKRLILEILKEKGLKKLFVYSSKFQVSEATISGDLEAIETWLNCYGLFIVRKPGSGVYVKGTEKNYRAAIRAFIEENMNTKLIQDAYETTFQMTSGYENIKKSGIDQMLEENTLKRVVDCVNHLKHARILSLTESSYMGLILHIAIAINRIQREEMIETDEIWLKQFEEDEDYLLAEDIVWALEEEFDLEIPEMEISYVCLHIKGAKHEKIAWKEENDIQLEAQEIRQLLHDMIYAFDPKKAYLLKQDEEFIQGLLAHLQPTLIRLKYDLQIQNPILEGVKRDYGELFEQCKIVAKVMENWIGKPIPEPEVGFLTIHFGAALVRAEGKKEEIRPVRVAVVCSSGIGISRLMSSKLEKIFKNRMMLNTFGKRDLTQYEEQKHDFCISSISLDQKQFEIPIIEVSPLLTDEDIIKIRRMVQKYERLPEKKKENIPFVNQMDEVHVVALQISKITKSFAIHVVSETISFEALLNDIGTQLSPHVDMQEVIKQNLLEREKVATQIYAEFEFALFHARTRGVVNPTFHVWVTKSLKAFQNPDLKGIHVAFVMLVPLDEHLKINTEIMGCISGNLVEDSQLLDAAKSGNEELLREVLSRKLKEYFCNDFLKSYYKN